MKRSEQSQATSSQHYNITWRGANSHRLRQANITILHGEEQTVTGHVKPTLQYYMERSKQSQATSSQHYNITWRGANSHRLRQANITILHEEEQTVTGHVKPTLQYYMERSKQSQATSSQHYNITWRGANSHRLRQANITILHEEERTVTGHVKPTLQYYMERSKQSQATSSQHYNITWRGVNSRRPRQANITILHGEEQTVTGYVKPTLQYYMKRSEQSQATSSQHYNIT